VKFVVSKDAIEVLNNECGFMEKNIRALCDVGRSTKGKHKSGYIGKWMSSIFIGGEPHILCKFMIMLSYFKYNFC